jgi:hypothetical protein
LKSNSSGSEESGTVADGSGFSQILGSTLSIDNPPAPTAAAGVSKTSVDSLEQFRESLIVDQGRRVKKGGHAVKDRKKGADPRRSLVLPIRPSRRQFRRLPRRCVAWAHRRRNRQRAALRTHDLRTRR